jgi:hypothetical protein
VAHDKEIERIEAVDHMFELEKLLGLGQDLDADLIGLGGTMRSWLTHLRAEIDRALSG